MTVSGESAAISDGKASGSAVPHGVLLVDELVLRREAYASLLAPWAAGIQLELSTADLDSCRSKLDGATFLILSCGSAAIAELNQRAGLSEPDLRGRILVVISDSEQAEEVESAISLGARGFLPATIAPALALKALSFILGGGDFFPPSALARRDRSRGGRMPG